MKTPRHSRLARLNLQLVWEPGEEAMAGVGDGGDVFDPGAADAGPVEAGLGGENLAGMEGGGAKARGFVELEAEAVAGAVEETAPAAIGLLGRVALGLEERLHFLVHLFAFDARLHFAQRHLLAGADGLPEMPLGVAGPA